jgi:hypothetical protein
MTPSTLRALTLSLLALSFLRPAFAGSIAELRAGFASPPDSAKPHTWWHWMNGNITKEGITADLEAMKQIGLGGATVVNVDSGIPAGPVRFMSPGWREAFKHAVSEASRLGFQLSVANCAGWSESGGPWVTPENGMQRLTSSWTEIRGPQAVDTTLTQPPTNLGLYRDIAVLAYKTPKKSSAANPDDTEGKLVIKRAFFGAVSGNGGADITPVIAGMIKDGKTSVGATVGELGGDPVPGEIKHLVLDFELDGAPGTLTIDEFGTLIFPTSAKQLAAARKKETTPFQATFVEPRTEDAANEPVPRDEILDLTANLDPSGKLRWDAPPGNWTILRIGYTPIGIMNHPAPAEGLGLEVDKMSKAALDTHWNGFMQHVLDDVGPLAGKSLTSSLIDSYEVGKQDWTPKFREEFIKRRGYDPVRFLPTLTHQIVENQEITERFLWDMRRTIADLFAENYFGHFAELCHQRGLTSDVEPYTGPFDSLKSGAAGDVVMGEFWIDTPVQPAIKMAASIAHIYGKTIVGAEAFTSCPPTLPWANDPFSIKALGDLTFSQGLNRFYFHRYALQPWTNRWPGMTMGENGFEFERTQTWWAQGKPWIEYITRCHFLLQQGRAVADAAYFTGEGAPSQMRIGNPKPPAGYDYDAVNTDVLMNGATVRNGRIVLKSGASYAVLILPEDNTTTTPEFLRCLQNLVNSGATVTGPRPQRSPSLTGYPSCDQTVEKMASELWDKTRIVSGKSLEQIFASQNLRPDFEFTGSRPDSKLVYCHRIDGDTDIYFVSNQTYQSDSAECTFRVTGKTPELWHPDTGKITPAPAWTDHDGRTTVHLDFDPAGSVFVIFRPGKPDHQSVAQTSKVSAQQKIEGPWKLSFPENWGAPPSTQLDQLISWTMSTDEGVRFFSGTGTYEKEITIPANLLKPGQELWLDLGTVKNFAEVSLNGHTFQTLWKPPFRVNITDAAKPGANQLIVKVTNLWPNRLIGDEHLPPDCEWNGNTLKAWPQWLLEGKPSPTGRLTFTTRRSYTKDSPLLDSGLLGPVTLQSVSIVP